MKRRKVLLGIGSLAAGSAAAMGTGAFTTMTSGERTTEVKVAADSKAYVELHEDGKYAEETEDGKLRLYFNDEQGIFEGGVNPDSTYHFEDVFSIAADHVFGDTYFYIEPRGFDVDVEFTADEDHKGASSFPNDPGQTLTDSDNPYKLIQPGEVKVDMSIDGTASPDATAGGEIVIHAAPGSERDKL